MTLRIDCSYSGDWLRVVAGDPALVELEITSPVEDRTLSVLLEDRAQVETLRNALSLWLGSNGPAVDLLNELNNWLVCSAIATPEDMAQSFETFQQKIDAVLGAYRPSEVPQ